VFADVQAAVLKEKARVAQLKEEEVLISASLLLSPSTFDSFIQDIRTETDLISKAAARDGKPLDALPTANAPQAEIEPSLADAPFYALAAVETALEAAGLQRVPQASTGLQPLSAREVAPAAAAEDGTRAMPTTEAEKVVEAEVLQVTNHLPPVKETEAVEMPIKVEAEVLEVTNHLPPVKETEAVEMPIKVEAAAAEEAEVAEEVQDRIGRSVGQRAPAAAVPVEHAVGVPTAAKENSDPFELLLDLIAGGIVVAEALKGESIGEPVDNSRSKSRGG
jgi:hypothetical protein